MITVPYDTVRAVFDIAIHSLDFGSGFLDLDQVEHLRALAVHLGVDPAEATPDKFRRRYCKGHDWRQQGKPYLNGNIAWRCEHCRSFAYEAQRPDARLGIAS